MEKLIEFVSKNNIWFLTISIVLLFALIGYIYDTKKREEDPIAKAEEEYNKNEIDNIVIKEDDSLNNIVQDNKLDDVVNTNMNSEELNDKQVQ